MICTHGSILSTGSTVIDSTPSLSSSFFSSPSPLKRRGRSGFLQTHSCLFLLSLSQPLHWSTFPPAAQRHFGLLFLLYEHLFSLIFSFPVCLCDLKSCSKHSTLHQICIQGALWFTQTPLQPARIGMRLLHHPSLPPLPSTALLSQPSTVWDFVPLFAPSIWLRPYLIIQCALVVFFFYDCMNLKRYLHDHLLAEASLNIRLTILNDSDDCLNSSCQKSFSRFCLDP